MEQMRKSALYCAFIIALVGNFVGQAELTKVGAICKDGTMSNYTGTNACDGHGGVHLWLAREDSLSERAVSVCSFNVQFLGHFTRKKPEVLADVVSQHDIVVIQELVAPPWDGTYPGGEAYEADPQAKAFFDAMYTRGFEAILSNEDTGTNDEIHSHSTGTEWWAAFYRPDIVQPAEDLPNGFLAEDRSNHPEYERVPYAFAFRDMTRNLDFVLISTHLEEGDNDASANRRAGELRAIANWIDANGDIEQDFIILGDMNIEECAELPNATPAGFQSLNDECRKTNTLPKTNMPYDHVMYRPTYTSREIDLRYDLKVTDLIREVQNTWDEPVAFPGRPYDHNLFKQIYSDHHPIHFRMVVPESDDD